MDPFIQSTVVSPTDATVVAIPMDKCFQLDSLVNSILVQAPLDSDVYLCIYNPTRNTDGLSPNQGIWIPRGVCISIQVYANTQIGAPDYLVGMSVGEVSYPYSVTPNPLGIV